MKKAIFYLLLAAGFTAAAQNFSKDYPFWNSDYGNQFVIPYPDGYATVGIKMDVGKSSIKLIRADLNGDTLFTKTLIDILSNTSLERPVADAEGFIYLTFRKNDSACIARFSPDWDLQWMHKFGLVYNFKSLAISQNNNLFAAGTGFNDGGQLHLFCLTSSGNIIWENSISAQTSLSLITIIELDNGELCIPVEMYNGYEMAWFDLDIFNFSASGDSLSHSSITLNGIFPSVRQILKNVDTLAIIYRSRYSPENIYNFRQISMDGTLIFEKEISLFDTDYGITGSLLTPGKELLVTGIKEGSNPDFYSTFICAMTFDGDSLWSVKYGDNFESYVSDIQMCFDGGYIVSGNFGSTIDRTVFLLKTDSLGNLNSLGIRPHSAIDAVRIYPNPATEFVVFEVDVGTRHVVSPIKLQAICITNIYGRQVAEVPLSGEKTVWDTRGIQPGVYLFEYGNGNSFNSGKIVITR